jgi:hypothetical protein
MPFSSRTSRRPSRHFVSLRRLEDANRAVTREMNRLGLWSDELAEVGVYIVPTTADSYGWHQGTPGSICIPEVSLAHREDCRDWRLTRLTDILRHEWAHALAAVHSGFVESPSFVRAFAGGYEDRRGLFGYDPARHLTRYAADNPAEDFAETFHFFLRHKGRLPVRFEGRPIIARKWRFVARIARHMAFGKSSFQ